MKAWFKGNITIHADLHSVKDAFDDHVSHFNKAVLEMPGMTKADVEESGPDFVIIRTNEGLMKRTKITKTLKDDILVIEFEENYANGKVVEITSLYQLVFKEHDDHVDLTCTIRLLKTKGFLGFIYKILSSRSIGNATLKSYKKVFE